MGVAEISGFGMLNGPVNIIAVNIQDKMNVKKE